MNDCGAARAIPWCSIAHRRRSRRSPAVVVQQSAEPLVKPLSMIQVVGAKLVQDARRQLRLLLRQLLQAWLGVDDATSPSGYRPGPLPGLRRLPAPATSVGRTARARSIENHRRTAGARHRGQRSLDGASRSRAPHSSAGRCRSAATVAMWRGFWPRWNGTGHLTPSTRPCGRYAAGRPLAALATQRMRVYLARSTPVQRWVVPLMPWLVRQHRKPVGPCSTRSRRAAIPKVLIACRRPLSMRVVLSP